MNLATRKYYFIQELMNIDKESVMDALERIIKREKEEHQDLSPELKKELDYRLKLYRENPEDVLDWDEIKESW